LGGCFLEGGYFFLFVGWCFVWWVVCCGGLGGLVGGGGVGVAARGCFLLFWGWGIWGVVLLGWVFLGGVGDHSPSNFFFTHAFFLFKNPCFRNMSGRVFLPSFIGIKMSLHLVRPFRLSSIFTVQCECLFLPPVLSKIGPMFRRPFRPNSRYLFFLRVACS